MNNKNITKVTTNPLKVDKNSCTIVIHNRIFNSFRYLPQCDKYFINEKS